MANMRSIGSVGPDRGTEPIEEKRKQKGKKSGEKKKLLAAIS